MPIRSIKLANFRNLSSLNIELSDGVNFIIGHNGTGKTSILEAIYLLSTGRSFRTNNLAKLIKFNCEYLAINAALASSAEQEFTTLVDYHRNKKADKRLLLNNSAVKSIAEIAAILPVCNIDGEVFHALSSAPMYRRQLYDWGVFHVKHEFLNSWRRYEGVLKQRNSLLRQHARLYVRPDAENKHRNIKGLREIRVWDNLFIDAAFELVQIRQAYFNLLEINFSYYIEKLLPKFSYHIRLGLNHGLGAELNNKKITDSDYFKAYLQAALADKLLHDLSRGYTSVGPHRMDIIFKYNDQVAKDLVSRGQEKLIIVAFYLAQLSVIKARAGKKCTVLIDDLAAELDPQSWQLLYQQLLASEHQLIFSAISEQQISLGSETSEPREIKMFHVEQLNKIMANID